MKGLQLQEEVLSSPSFLYPTQNRSCAVDGMVTVYLCRGMGNPNRYHSLSVPQQRVLATKDVETMAGSVTRLHTTLNRYNLDS